MFCKGVWLVHESAMLCAYCHGALSTKQGSKSNFETSIEVYVLISSTFVENDLRACAARLMLGKIANPSNKCTRGAIKMCWFS
jgi:hypothetical protein